MTTTTVKTPLADAMGPALQAKTARNSFMDTLRATPRKARAWVGSVIRTLHLDGLASSVRDGAAWLLRPLARVGRFLKGLGLLNIAGVFVTLPPARRFAVKALGTAYRIATTPIRWVGRALRWGLNSFGFGRKVVAKVESSVAKAETWAIGKVETGLTWMDTHQNHGAMKWAAWFFQANIVRKGVAMLFPGLPAWAPYLVSLLIPTVEYSFEEEAAIERAHLVLADTPTLAEDLDALKAASAAPETPQVPVQPAPVQTRTYIIADSSRPTDDPTIEVEGFVDPKGTVRVYLGSQLLMADDLPESMSLVGESLGEPISHITPLVHAPRAGARATGNGSRPAKKAAGRRR